MIVFDVEIFLVVDVITGLSVIDACFIGQVFFALTINLTCLVWFLGK